MSGEQSAEDRGRRLQQLEKKLALCERDRALIAFELHDGLAQQLTAASMHVDAAAVQVNGDPTEAAAMLRQASDRLRDSMAELRRLMRGIRPPHLESHGLSAAITDLICELQNSGLQIALSLNVTTPRLIPAVETAAYRIVQESLTNVARHSGSKSAQVEVTESSDSLQITVNDQGCGFDAAHVSSSRFGLRGIRERAQLLGGSAEITSQPGCGTTVCARLPLVDPVLE